MAKYYMQRIINNLKIKPLVIFAANGFIVFVNEWFLKMPGKGEKHSCSKKYQYLKTALIMLVLLLPTGNMLAALRTASTTGDWTSTTTWGGQSVPTSVDDVIINPGITLTVNTAAQCNSLVFSNNPDFPRSSLVVASGNSLTISNSITLNNGSWFNVTGFISGGGSLSCASVNVGNLTAPSNSTFTHTLESSVASFVISGDLNIQSRVGNNDKRLSNGVFTQTGGSLTINGAVVTSNDHSFLVSGFVLGNNSPTLNLAGATPFSLAPTGTSDIVLNGTGATVNYSFNGAQTIYPVNYTNLILSAGGAKTMQPGTTDIAGNFTLSGTVSATAVGNLLISGNVNIGSGTVFDLSTYTANRATAGGALTVAGTLRLGGTSGGRTGSNFPNNFTTHTMTNGTVEYNNPTGGQTVFAAPTYHNLILRNAGGTQSAGGALTINGALTTIAGGILNMGTNQLAGTFSAIANNGTIQTQNTSTTPFPAGKTWGGTIQINGTSAQTIPASTFTNIIISNAAGATLSGAVSVSGILSLEGGRIATSVTNLLSIANSSTLAISGGSSTSFINGPVRRSLPAGLVSGSTYFFPVGKGTTYLPFSLVNPTTGTGTVTAQLEAFAANPGGSIDGTLISKSTTEYWSLITGGNFTNSSISVSRPTAISPLNALGQSTTLAGTYTALNGTIETFGITNSGNIGANRFFVLAQRSATLSTGTITGSSFCAGASVSVPYTKTGTFNLGNVFTAQLSNASGSFATPVTVGTLTSTASGTISATIPVGAVYGTGYRIRVVSSNPAITGTDNGVNLTINAIPAIPTATGGLICIGSTATLSALGAATGDRYVWYSASNGGTVLKTSTNNTDNTFTTAVLGATTNYWVSILNAGGCESSRTQVTATFPTASTGNQNDAGTNSWIGHVYDGTAFNTYYGRYTESETFDQNFGGNTNCFSITSNSVARSIYTETFSVRYRMNSTKKGLYVVDLGSDDGGRLTVDGTLLYSNWVDQAFSSRPRILMSLKGTSSLIYDFYENAGGNRVVFQNLTQVLTNTLSANTTQSITVGATGSEISGDIFGSLPAGISLSGTGYQWTYSTTPGGTRTNITGATGATYTPNASSAPFNTPGTYYIYRNAVLSSTNNVSPNPYVASNESNVATLTVVALPLISTSATTLTGFSYPEGYGPSGEQSFTVSGTNLTDNIRIIPSNSFEISTGTGALFVPSALITLPVVGGAVAPKTIYVRMKAGLPLGLVASENLLINSTGATEKNVACSGSVISAPVIITTPAALSGFSYTFTAGPSAQQSFAVSGSNLLSNVVITPPAGYEISTTSGSGFVSTPISLAPTSGTLSSRLIYVRMKISLGVGAYTEDIVVSSDFAVSKNVTCSGTVNPAPTITTNVSALSTFIYTSGSGTSGTQTFRLIGTNLGTNAITVTPPANFAIQNPANQIFTTSAFTIAPTNGSVDVTLTVRMVAGLATGIYGPSNVSLTCTGAVVKTVALSGQVVSAATILVSKSTLTGFGYMQGSGPSGEQLFTVSGSSLTANISITPPANYEISLTSGSGFQSTAITLARNGAKIDPTPVYVRLKSGLSAGNYNTGSISCVSSGVTRSVSLIGVVFATPLISASNNGPYCAGSPINLASTGDDIVNRYWVGPNAFYSTIQNPVLANSTTAMSGTYTVTGNVYVGGNLITNGDFEAGNTSFGSSYGYPAMPFSTSSLVPEGLYAIVQDAATVHSNFTGLDHTPSPGVLHMVINGNTIQGAVIWTQSVPVVAGANYEFSYWVQSVVKPYDSSPSKLQLYVNGKAAGPVYTANPAINTWTQFIYNTNAGNNTMLNLELINQNTAAGGNDFSLDDISFQQILTASASTNVTVNPILPVSVSVSASANPVYKNTPVTYTATPVNGGDLPIYQWKVNGQNAGTNSSTFIYTPLNGDIVSCTVTSSLPCVTGNPATSSVTMTVTERNNYWMGYIDTDWGKAGNWTGNFVPLTGDDVEYATVANFGSAAQKDLQLDKNRIIGNLINASLRRLVIPAGYGLTVNKLITTDGNPDRIYIYSGSSSPNGSLIYFNPENLPVSATVEMYSKASWDLTQPINNKFKWQYFGIPLRSVVANPVFSGAYVRKWDETGDSITNHWKQLSNESVLLPFYGYEITHASPKTFVFKGQLVNSDFNSGALAITPAALYPGQHIFANPYTAAIDIQQLVFGADTEESVYLYNTGTFSAWDINGGAVSSSDEGQYLNVPKRSAGQLGIPRQLPSMQAMLVKAKGNVDANVRINYSAVVMNNTDMRRAKRDTTTTGSVGTRIEVTGRNFSDRMWLVSQPGCTPRFDNGWDGFKMMGNAMAPQIFAVQPDGNYQVNSVDDINGTLIGFRGGLDTEYTMVFKHQDIRNHYQGMYLHDLAEDITVDITESGTEYKFIAGSTSEHVNRFRIITRYYEKNAPDTDSSIKVFSYAKTMFVQNTGSVAGDLYIYDIAGRFIAKKPFRASDVTPIQISLLPGAYAVKAVAGVERVSKRIILR